MLKVSGIFVAPAEIENCLLQHKAVLECAVIGNDAGDGLVKPKAFVVLRADWGDQLTIADAPSRISNDTLAEELKDFVRSNLAPYKYPRWIEFVPSLPKNDRGKIDRRKLKEN